MDSLELQRRTRIHERSEATARVTRWTAALVGGGLGLVGLLSLAAAATFAGHQQDAAAQQQPAPPEQGAGQPVQPPDQGGGFFGGGGGGGRPVAVSGGS